jgi:multidrug efflux pump subunit AcrA (membrane-fusion protein)
MEMTRWAWVLLLIAVIVLAGCCTRAEEVPAGATPVDADTTPQPTLPPPLPAGQAVVADGQLESPYPSLPLGFGGGVSGQVLTITVKAGDVVQVGDLLALLDDTDLQRAVDDAQLALDRAVADREQALQQWERDVADAEKALADAERALATARLQYSDTGVEEARTNLKWAQKAESDRKAEYEKAMAFWPPIPVDGYRDSWHRAIDEHELAEMRLADAEDAHSADSLELVAREEDVAQAERSLTALEGGIAPSYERAVEDAERELAKAQEDLEHARLTAPWAAIVLSVDVAPKATVGAGASVVTLLNVEDGLRFVTQNLSEQHIADIYPGQRAVVTLRTFADTSLEATVEAVVPQVGEAVEADGRFTVRVRLSPTDPSSASGQSLRLLPGLTGRVEIFAGE